MFNEKKYFLDKRPLKKLSKMIKRGITPKYTEEKGIDVINQRCIRDFKIDFALVRKHNLQERNVVEEKLLKKYDVLINSTGVGTLGRVSQYFDESNIRTVDSHVTIVRPVDTVNPIYFGYAVKNEQKRIEALGEGSTGQTELSRVRLGDEIFINLPSSKIQKNISKTLLSLDDKIDNNNAIISNLEEQAQAIFKSWFIDFEPFQDGEFVDSELGKIPAGWKVKKLGDLFSFVKGRKPKAIYEEYQSDSVPYILKKYIDGSEISFVNKEDGILLQELNVFMLMDGANSGNIYYGYKGILGSTFSLISTNSLFDEEYLYWYLKIKETEIRNQNTGSAIPHANKDYIQNIKISLPINIKKDEIIKSLRKIRENSISLRKQNQTLAQLRDTLLPKLMSGEIRVGSEELEEVKNQV